MTYKTKFRVKLLIFTIGTAVLLLLPLLLRGETPAPAPSTISDEELAKLTDADIAATEAHRQQLLQDAQDNVKKVGETAQNQGASLTDIQTANTQASKAFGAYKEQAEKDIAKGNAAIVALNSVLKKLHRAKWIACGLVVAVAGLVFIKMPGQIGAYLAGAIAISGCAFVWMWL